jgi:hypothetical protein
VSGCHEGIRERPNDDGAGLALQPMKFAEGPKNRRPPNPEERKGS